MRTSLILAALAGLATAAAGQDLRWIATPFDNTLSGGTANDAFKDIDSFSSATSAFLIGNQPISVAYDGANLYLGGNINGSATRVAVAEISDFFGTAGAKNVEGSDINPAILGPSFSGRGYTGMDWSDQFGLVATLDKGSNAVVADGNPLAPDAQVFLWRRNAPTDFGITLQGAVGGVRGISGPAFDFGFDGLGYGLASGSMGPAIAVPELGRGSPFGIDPSDITNGTVLYTPDLPLYSLFISGTSTTWRDYDIHPTNGLVVARANNFVLIGDRTQFNGTTNLRFITPPGGTGSAVNQNVEIVHNPACGADFLVFNDRPTSSTFFPTFQDHVLMYDAAGSQLSYTVEFPDGSPATLLGGSNIYSFFWDEPSQTLFVCDGINRDVYALTLDCDTGPAGCNVADITPDFGVLNVNDIIDFVNGFNGGNLAVADISPAPDGDGLLNVNDIVDFVNAFNAGCP